MSDLLLSEGATNKAKEADHFAFLISDVVIPDGTPRLDVVASLADAGIYTTEDDLVYGMDESDSRNERMLIKAVGHLGDSNHRWAMSQPRQPSGSSTQTQSPLRLRSRLAHDPRRHGGVDVVRARVPPLRLQAGAARVTHHNGSLVT